MSTAAAPPPSAPARLAIPGLAVVLGAVGVLLLATSTRYGYHRDELYFLACGHHLAWGYPDQGPLVPLLAAVFDELGRGSLLVFRLPGMLCVLGTALVSAQVARELGGRGHAQVLTGVVVGLGGFPLAVGHIVVTATVDVLVWTVVLWLVVRAVRTGQPRLWLPAGLVAGVGLLNKDLPIVLLLSLGLCLLLLPELRPALRTPWPWAGLALAAVCWTPTVLWQAAHGWPQVVLSQEIHAEYSSSGNRIGFAVLQLLMFSPVGLWLWVTGTWRLVRDRSVYRLLALVWLATLVTFVATAGQGYYTAGTYPPLVAAGAVAFEARLRRPVLAPAVLVLAVLAAAATMPAFIPLVPARTLAGTPAWAGLGENQLETVGWPALVSQVAAAYRSLPAEEQSAAVLVVANYGEAGALDRYGPALGLPPVYSGHNAYGLWGPPPETASVVVGVFEESVPPALRDCRSKGRVRNPERVANEESTRATVYVCRAPAVGWRRAWPGFVHLSA